MNFKKWSNIIIIVLCIAAIITKLLYKPDVGNLGLALPIFFMITNFIGLFKQEENAS